MYKESIDNCKGIFINENEFRRQIKLFASPKSLIARKHFALGMTIIGVNKIHESHAHDSNEEIVLVYEGKGIAKIGEKQINIEKGDLIGIEKKESHKFINDGCSELKLLWIYSPPGEADEKFLLVK